MSETPLVWFNEWRKRWLVVCPLRRCQWHGSDEDRGLVEHLATLHEAVCPGRPTR